MTKSIELTTEQYAAQCVDDIEDIVILHALSPTALLALDSDLFPINFEVWDETNRVLGLIDYQNYKPLMPDDLAQRIGHFLRSLLQIPADQWCYEQFSQHPQWQASRTTARQFINELGLQGRRYGQ